MKARKAIILRPAFVASVRNSRLTVPVCTEHLVDGRVFEMVSVGLPAFDVDPDDQCVTTGSFHPEWHRIPARCTQGLNGSIIQRNANGDMRPSRDWCQLGCQGFQQVSGIDLEIRPYPTTSAGEESEHPPATT
jgi:hypothetical protein